MKKVISFLRSMKFGMILLVLVIACSFAGSMIVQQRTAMEYVSRYGEDAAQLILALGLDDVFSAPYFLVLMAALCLNLILCSLVRLPRVLGAKAALLTSAKKAKATTALEDRQHAILCRYFEKRLYRADKHEGRTVFFKNGVGFFGSFVTHLSFLLILVVGAAAVVTADVRDQVVMPGETLTLESGVSIRVDSFQIVDETGMLDYASELTVSNADGSKNASKQIRVNEPLSFEGHKIYQQTYGTAGAVRITNHQTGVSEDMILTESCFLTLDGINGMFYQALYPGYIQDADGSVTLITSTSGAYTDPVYDIVSVAGGAMTPVLAFPDETLTVGDVSFTLLSPVSYPGLRIKHMNPVVLGLLYATFVLMVAGLYLCFFTVPLAIAVEKDGYVILSPKVQTGLMIELGALLKEE
ncbi:MAG: cytochrome c biogenesis protein ResB [Clostridia bacterium]|nr:cytochrome c biogenesis protein ResB [Clostridia bacterium]